MVMFALPRMNGDEVQACEGAELAINHETGVFAASRVDGFEEITTCYSPSTWQSVTQRNRGQGVRLLLILTAR